MPFITNLDVELRDEERGMWVLTAPLIYRVVNEKIPFDEILVPQGFATDFMSVPRLPFAYSVDGNIAQRAATVHDWLYSSTICTRSIADYVLRAIMEEDGYGWVRRWSTYLAVRLFGSSHYMSDDNAIAKIYGDMDHMDYKG